MKLLTESHQGEQRNRYQQKQAFAQDKVRLGAAVRHGAHNTKHNNDGQNKNEATCLLSNISSPHTGTCNVGALAVSSSIRVNERTSGSSCFCRCCCCGFKAGGGEGASFVSCCGSESVSSSSSSSSSSEAVVADSRVVAFEEVANDSKVQQEGGSTT